MQLPQESSDFHCDECQNDHHDPHVHFPRIIDRSNRNHHVLRIHVLR